MINDSNKPSDEDNIAIMKKQMARWTGDASSQSRTSMVVEEVHSVSCYMDFNYDLYNNGFDQELYYSITLGPG